MTTHTCTACGWPRLEHPPRGTDGGGSMEICPSCGFQHGVSDDDEGITPAQWRTRWIKAGLQWSSKGQRRPREWDAAAQVATVQRKRKK